jgi:hypothetical protein
VGKYKYQIIIELNQMDELLDMIIADESPSQISDKIKDIAFCKVSRKN